MNKINFGLIGCGHIGKRHLEMIERNPHAEIIALTELKSRQQINIGNQTIPFYSDMQDMLKAHPEIDVVAIASPNGFHANQAIKSLEAEKHVIIEKPMALNKRDAEKIIYTSLQMNKQVFVVMQNRFSPPSIWIKGLLNSGMLGKIYLVELNCYWNRDSRYYTKDSWHGKKDLDGGTLFTQFSHFIDIMYWLFGDIYNIHSRLYNFNHELLTEFEDSGLVTFDFINGGSGILSFSTSLWDANMESSMTIISQNGTIKIGGQYMEKVEYCHINNYKMPELAPTNPGNDYGMYKGSAQNHNFVYENVIDVINQRSSISTNALEGLKVVDIIERIYLGSSRI